MPAVTGSAATRTLVSFPQRTVAQMPLYAISSRDPREPQPRRLTWLIIAEDENQARMLVPTPFIPEKLDGPTRDASGPNRIIGWMGEAPTPVAG